MSAELEPEGVRPRAILAWAAAFALVSAAIVASAWALVEPADPPRHAANPALEHAVFDLVTPPAPKHDLDIDGAIDRVVADPGLIDRRAPVPASETRMPEARR